MSQTKDKQPVSTLLSWRHPCATWSLFEEADGTLTLDHKTTDGEPFSGGAAKGLTDADLEAVESLLRAAIRHRKRAGKGAG